MATRTLRVSGLLQISFGLMEPIELTICHTAPSHWVQAGEIQSSRLVKSAHEIHSLNGAARCTFHQIVDSAE